MDEEEIIRRRDGLSDAASDGPLGSDATRALADARLRALSFALKREQIPGAGREETDDAELLAYLLDALPEARRTALEESLRGNAGVFVRLVTLRNALSSKTDKRDRQRADDPARKIGRHAAGRVEVRRRGRILQFKNAAERPRTSGFQARLSMRASEPAAYRMSREPAFREMKRPWRERAADISPLDLENARHDLDAAMRLVDEARTLLDRSDLTPGVESRPGKGGPRDARERLTELLIELQLVHHRIRGWLGSDFAQSGISARPAHKAPPEPEDLFFEAFEAKLAMPLDDRDSPWADTYEVEAGPWALHLAGAVDPVPRLAVSMQRSQPGLPATEPLITLVRPASGFEVLNLDGKGSGKVALPVGESVMLVQADEVWEIRLRYGD